jgi:Dolichyl-phosphate-mannose-protein mannosyltransferase
MRPTWSALSYPLRSSTRAVSIWLGPSSKSFDLLRLYALSAAVGIFYLYFGMIGIENGASSYTDWADAIVHGTTFRGNIAFYIRDVGMALVLLISGYTITHSLIGVMIIQTMMGIAMPVLAYLALRPWFPRTAYYAGIASVLSLAPFLLSKTLHHDQPYVFFMILSMYITNNYIAREQRSDLYGLTLCVFLLSLIRQTGKILYPGLIVICLVSSRKNYKHIAACVVIFVACNFGYAKYRDYMMGNLPALGIEAFENVYLNSSEYGVELSPAFGPDVKLILDRARECSLPDPAHAESLQTGPSTPDFMKEHFYNYTSDQLVQQIVLHSNREYLYYLLGCVSNNFVELNHIFLMASLETAWSRPLYVLDYAIRNSWELMYDPGWLHSRETLEPHLRGGLLFQLGGATTAGRGNIGDHLPEPAMSEAEFLPLARQPDFIKDIYFAVESAWADYYHPVTEILFYLICVTWFSTAIGLLRWLWPTERLRQWSSQWLSDCVVPGTSAVSFLLLANVGVSGLFIDSYYRYDYSLTVLKVMLATVGCAIILNLVWGPILASVRFSVSLGSLAGARLARNPVEAAEFKSPRHSLRRALHSRVALFSVAFIAICVLALANYVRSERMTVAPVAVPKTPATAPEIGPETELNRLPELPKSMRWDQILGLNATALAGPQVIEGQTPLLLVAVNDDGRHALALHFRNFAPGGDYRATVWVKSQTNIQLQVRDSVNSQTGKANEGEARFNLATGASLMAQGNVIAQGVEQDADGWRKVWVELRTADGDIFVTVGMLEAGSNSHVFKGVGQQLILGGVEIVALSMPMQH